MRRSEVGLAEQHEDGSAGMALTDLGNFIDGVAVAGADLAQIFSGHAIEAVNGVTVFAGGDEQFVEGAPFVSPVGVETDALAKFVLVDFAAPPFLEHVLMTGEDGFDPEHNGAIYIVG